MTDSKNAAQIRGDIQRGLTGDKRPGFDPATAPLETDSEAGGAPLSSEQTEMALRQEKRQGDEAGPQSYGNAMRRQRRGRDHASPLLFWAGAALLVAAALAVVVVMGNV